MCIYIQLMKKFDVPDFYRSNLIGAIKNLRKELDPKKKDFSPTIVDFGPVQIHLARHFGFCYGVENAIEISYKAIEENPDKNIYLLSQILYEMRMKMEKENIKWQMTGDEKNQVLLNWLRYSIDRSEIVEEDFLKNRLGC